MARSIDGLFEGYRLIQDSRFFKLGTDSVLLSDFIKLRKNSRVCDIGAGCGALSVLLAVKYPEISIDAVEIISEAACIARENMALNGLSGRVSVFDADIRAVKGVLSPSGYDAVFANPPYFQKDAGRESALEGKNNARSEHSLNVDELLSAAKYLLKWGGRFFAVYRTQRMSDLLCAMKNNKIEPKRMRFYHKDSKSSPRIFMVEGVRGGSSGLVIQSPLYGKDSSGRPSEEFLRIYHRRGGE